MTVFSVIDAITACRFDLVALDLARDAVSQLPNRRMPFTDSCLIVSSTFKASTDLRTFHWEIDRSMVATTASCRSVMHSCVGGHKAPTIRPRLLLDRHQEAPPDSSYKNQFWGSSSSRHHILLSMKDGMVSGLLLFMTSLRP